MSKPKISKFGITNFRRFEVWSLPSIPSPLVLMGDNGSGKTTILWAMVLFFRGFNSVLKNGQKRVLKNDL
jgi:recombinational DNA repair ATPase RecF